MNINKVILTGRLTADPELKKTNDGISVVRITVAVNRPKQKDKEQKADFLPCVAFRQTAEFISKYFRKGSAIIVFGAIRTGSYDKDGTKVYTTDITVDEVQFGENKAQKEAEHPATNATTPNLPPVSASEYTLVDDSDLPF